MKRTLDYYKKKLKKLYESFSWEYPSDIPSAKAIHGPLLISPTNEYAKSEKKIMIVGQETGGWGWNKDSYKDFCDGKMTIDCYMTLYEEFLKNNHRGPFWSEFKRIEKRIFNTDHGTILWQNLIKFDFNKKSIFTASSTVSILLSFISMKLFKKEMKILQPDVIILFTGFSKKYEDVLKKWYKGIVFKDIPGNQIQGRKNVLTAYQRVIHKDLPSLTIRTHHPRSIYLQTSLFRQKTIDGIISILKDCK